MSLRPLASPAEAGFAKVPTSRSSSGCFAPSDPMAARSPSLIHALRRRIPAIAWGRLRADLHILVATPNRLAHCLRDTYRLPPPCGEASESFTTRAGRAQAMGRRVRGRSGRSRSPAHLRITCSAYTNALAVFVALARPRQRKLPIARVLANYRDSRATCPRGLSPCGPLLAGAGNFMAQVLSGRGALAGWLE